MGKKGDDEQSGGAADTQAPAAQHEPHRAAAPPSAGHQQGTDDEHHRRQERLYWAVTGAASVGATTATIFAAWFAFRAYEASWHAVGEARQQVAAALAANEISRRTLAEAVGASVYFGAPTFYAASEPDGRPRLALRVPIGNSGGSTTRGLRHRAACVDTNVPSRDPFDRRRLAAAQLYRAALGPREVRDIVACDYGAPEMGRIVAERRSVYVYGEATYLDNIDPAIAHRVRFCARIHSLTLSPRVSGVAEACEKNNCTDDECDAP
jgi:hypothetical protein